MSDFDDIVEGLRSEDESGQKRAYVEARITALCREIMADLANAARMPGSEDWSEDPDMVCVVAVVFMFFRMGWPDADPMSVYPVVLDEKATARMYSDLVEDRERREL